MSRRIVLMALTVFICCAAAPIVWAQEQEPAATAADDAAQPAVAGAAEEAEEKKPAEQPAEKPLTEEVKSEGAAAAEAVAKTAEETETHLSKQLDDLAKTVDESDTAKETTAGILTPIYRVAEALEFPAFHWIAFALMLSGVVGFALQLVIGKLVVFAHFGFSLREILSDLLGFVISAVGLVLTTQAAAQNSTFTQSPFAVISASVVGLIVGVFLYAWGQSQEVDAVRGRAAAAKEKPKDKK